MIQPPCKDCIVREIGCHARCTAYIDWKKTMENARREQTAIELDDYEIKRARRWKEWGRTHK